MQSHPISLNQSQDLKLKIKTLPVAKNGRRKFSNELKKEIASYAKKIGVSKASKELDISHVSLNRWSKVNFSDKQTNKKSEQEKEFVDVTSCFPPAGSLGLKAANQNIIELNDQLGRRLALPYDKELAEKLALKFMEGLS